MFPALMRIRWTQPALRDFDHICDYTEEHNGTAVAQSLALQMHATLERLASFPRMGRPGRRRDTRELIFAGVPFLAIYRVREDVVEILRILHGAQRWP